MGILDKLWKNPNEDSSTDIKEPVKKAAPLQQKQTVMPTSIPSYTPSVTPVSITPSTGNVIGSVNQDFVDYFHKIFDETNLPGPDFHEFVSALENMKNIPMDEQPKYLAVYATLITQGCTKQKLVDSAKIYLEKFAEKRNGFSKALEAQMSESVGGKQSIIDGLKKKNDEIDAEIKRLADQKVANAEQANKLSLELNEEATKLNIKKADFETTYNSMVAGINDSLDKIQRFIN